MHRPSPLSCAICVALFSFLAAPSAAAKVWIVAANGQGDFTTVQAAVDAAAPGDVLRILPGSYAGATVTKRLALVGDPSGAVPEVASVDVAGTPAVTLSTLAIARLRIVGAGERSIVERCTIGPGTPWNAPFFAWSACVVDGCAEIVFDECTITGGLDGSGSGYAGFVARGSRVFAVACDVRGGHGAVSGTNAGRGGDAVHLWGGTDAWFAACRLVGGDGLDVPGGAPGLGGDALRIGQTTAAAWADVRGGAAHELRAGFANPGASGPGDGRALRVMHACAGAPAPKYGGITTIGAVDACAVAHTVAAPYLVLPAADGPGGVTEARLCGASGAIGLVAVGYAPSLLPLPTVLGAPVAIDPQTVVLMAPLALHGLDVPATVPLVQPAASSLVGFAVHAQGFEITPFGFVHATPATAWVLSF